MFRFAFCGAGYTVIEYPCEEVALAGHVTGGGDWGDPKMWPIRQEGMQYDLEYAHVLGGLAAKKGVQSPAKTEQVGTVGPTRWLMFHRLL